MSAPEALFLRHHAKHARVVRFKPLEGPLQEITLDEMPKGRETDRGFFAETDDDLVAVYASPKGPMFVFGSRHLRLFEDTQGRVLTSDGKGRFVLERKGHEPLEITYAVPDTTNAVVFEPWEQEDDLDFFRWLTERLKQPTFFSHYTL